MSNDATTDTQSPLTPVKTTDDGQPDPAWVRGVCPVCGDVLVSNMYADADRAFIVRWECWGALQAVPTCTYRRVL